ncbi:MAG: NAD(P)H-hydrate epimerase [Candidatus Omnitrophica bacterium]|nr:NAD(P)H-hydrate epimerase [Candidatus Omnitrophota bacterium]
MRYVTAKEMKEIDARAIEGGTPAQVLMENAGKAVAEEAMKIAAKSVVAVFCGYGNNGGDGFVAARYLIENGYDVKAFLVGKEKPFSPETRSNFEALAELKCKPLVISQAADLIEMLDAKGKPAIVIDAIFGIGIRGDLEDLYISVIEAVNSLGVPVIAVDIPSGLDADTGKPLPVAVNASVTVTMGYPKAGFKLDAAKPYIGRLVVADIGLDANAG